MKSQSFVGEETQGEGVLVEVRNLKKYFPIGNNGLFNRQCVKAVDCVSFDICAGETLGLVGESGCGKSTLGRTLTYLHEPTEGSIRFEGQDVGELRPRELKALRRKMQFIFQDPSASLNPRRTVRSILMEPFIIHGIGTPAEREERIRFLMDRVGMEEYYLSRYSHEMSGGQKQRIGVARALALSPKLIVCDEAVSALDVSIQAQVINLLVELQKDFKLTYLFISHNLNVIHHISDRVATMYLGQMVELGSQDAVYERALHPYTKALISAIPQTDPDGARPGRILLPGDVPSPVNPPDGCRFHTRCTRRMEICEKRAPEFIQAEPGHYVSCHLFG